MYVEKFMDHIDWNEINVRHWWHRDSIRHRGRHLLVDFAAELEEQRRRDNLVEDC